MDAANAADEFRWGVLAFHKQLFNEAGLAFNRSLAYKSENLMVRDWLGRSYFRSGFEDSALKIWNAILDSGNGTSLLRNRVNVLTALREQDIQTFTNGEYIVARKFESMDGRFRMFSRPTSVVPRRDGSFFLVSWASNEIFVFNANAARVRRIQAGFEGLHQPFDLIESGEFLFVSEFGADRIVKCSPDGDVLIRFGVSGRGNGGLLGPQYLAADQQGYIYVTDIGNKQVSKFDEDGRFILSFGRSRGSRFPGLKHPTGIVVLQEKVFVADADHKSVFVFDLSGNFLFTLPNLELLAPEGITAMDSHTIIIADGIRLIAYDLNRSQGMQLTDFQGEAMRIVKAAVDINGNIIAADINGNRVFILSEIATMTAGYFVQINRIIPDNFPEIIAEITVEDRFGKPICGLDANNFILTENFQSTGTSSIIFKGNDSDKINFSVLLDASPEMAQYTGDIRNALEEINLFSPSIESIRLLSAGELPVLESRPEDLRDSLPLIGSGFRDFSPEWRFDLGLRLAVSQLMIWEDKRAIVFITAGKLPDSAFSDYGLIDLAGYLQNNRISFHVVYLNKTEVSDELTYLCEQTGGTYRYLYEPRGLRSLPAEILQTNSGSYYIKYTSPSLPEYGTEYIPVEVEAALFTKSGRDEMGYFAPE